MSAKIIADSITSNGVRLTSVEARIHRFVLAELNTHRKFSRNSASSRAIPVEKTLAKLTFLGDRAFPLEWPCEQPGMQGGSQLTDHDLYEAEELLMDIQADTLVRINDYVAHHPDKSTRLHKSLLNRPLEWFSWHTVLISSTEWQNFFDQRCSPLAQPEMRIAAEQIRDAMALSTPRELDVGEWHLPYVDDDESFDFYRPYVSAARCARVSYETHDGERDGVKDQGLFTKLHDASPPHWSPMEHPAMVGESGRKSTSNFDTPWIQLREMLS